MAGVELTDCGLVVDREPNRLEDLAVGFSDILCRLDINRLGVAQSRMPHVSGWDR